MKKSCVMGLIIALVLIGSAWAQERTYSFHGFTQQEVIYLRDLLSNEKLKDSIALYAKIINQAQAQEQAWQAEAGAATEKIIRDKIETEKRTEPKP
jgi:hypothetical protein